MSFNKRGPGSFGGLQGRDKKRAKNAEFRNIRVQKDFSKARMIQVEDFVEARAFEVNAMENALIEAKKANNTRAFQTLPRHLRRRAASHNVKRMPARLRAKALDEMGKSDQPSKKQLKQQQKATGNSSGNVGAVVAGATTISTLSKSRGKPNRRQRRKATSIAAEYQRRQSPEKQKRWLETHIWHAKRMHMKKRWNTMIAETPAQKSHRASYRAASTKCMIQDLSFMVTIQITGSKGNQKMMYEVLNAVASPTEVSVGAKRFVDGSRIVPLTLYKAFEYPMGCIGPAIGLWQQQLQDDGEENKRFWLRVHPAMKDQILTELSKAVNLICYSANSNSSEIEIQDITADLCWFDLTGDLASTNLLKTILTPVNETSSQNTTANNEKQLMGSQVWNILTGNNNNDSPGTSIISPSALSNGIVLGFEVEDPRLTFPHKQRTTSPENGSNETSNNEVVDELFRNWPNCSASYSKIWNPTHCKTLLNTRQTDHQLNLRRKNALVPGQKLKYDPEIDIKVPILLIQKSAQSLSGSGSSSNNSDLYQGNCGGGDLTRGWMLVVPSGWAMSFWLSLVFAGGRPNCGLKEQANIALESTIPIYPRMWVGTHGYREWIEEQAFEKWMAWHKKPPAKRISFGKIGTRIQDSLLISKSVVEDRNSVSPFYPSLGVLLPQNRGDCDDEGMGKYSCENKWIKETDGLELSTGQSGVSVEKKENEDESKSLVENNRKESKYWTLKGEKIIETVIKCISNSSSSSSSSSYKNSRGTGATQSRKDNLGVRGSDNSDAMEIENPVTIPLSPSDSDMYLSFEEWCTPISKLINRSKQTRYSYHQDNKPDRYDLSKAMVNVHLKCCKRGVPNYNAIIATPTSSSSSDKKERIGYIIDGGFGYKSGQGHGIGVCSLYSLYLLSKSRYYHQQDQKRSIANSIAADGNSHDSGGGGSQFKVSWVNVDDSNVNWRTGLLQLLA
ncbi:Ribonucleases P/MRP protein subunit pop1 [Mycoemilia scoparia]|uniref:Ribonucleases P/MRP protein subunit pop1 n=1 Tax=Mycoemilia scoparia TaxID=417184 RepID=A0A9W7ZW42_9FUNG|nr:Ribonucleases P/MRP protein subunit pop1 [Mycoemilia scoparia]